MLDDIIKIDSMEWSQTQENNIKPTWYQLSTKNLINSLKYKFRIR